MELTKLRSLNGHSSAVNAVRFTSDGSYCMTCSDDRTVRLWNPLKDDPTNEGNALLIKTYSGAHGYQIFDIAIAEDKTKFATGGGDRTSFLWDVATGRVIRRIQGHTQRINAVCLNENSSLLLTGSYDKTLSIWDLKSNMREPIQSITDFRDSVTSIKCTSSEIIAGSVDGCLRIYDLRVGQVGTDSIGLPVTHVQLSHDKKCILASCLGGNLNLVETRSGKLLQTYSGRIHNSFKLEASFCHDAIHLCGASEDGQLKFFKMVSGLLIPYSASLGGLDDDLSMKSYGNNNFIRNNNSMSTDSIVGRSKQHDSPIYTVACHPSKEVVVSGSSDGAATCWSYRINA